jgi:hypothetical protein
MQMTDQLHALAAYTRKKSPLQLSYMKLPGLRVSSGAVNTNISILKLSALCIRKANHFLSFQLNAHNVLISF